MLDDVSVPVRRYRSRAIDLSSMAVPFRGLRSNNGRPHVRPHVTRPLRRNRGRAAARTGRRSVVVRDRQDTRRAGTHECRSGADTRQLREQRRRPELRDGRRPIRRAGKQLAEEVADAGRQRRGGSRGRAQRPAQSLPGSKQQRFDRGLGDPERDGELLVREPAELTEHERLLLPARQLAEISPKRLQLGGVR
jgi:hypothetical protein